MVWKVIDTLLFASVAFIINLGMLSAVIKATDFSQRSFGVFVVVIIGREAVRKFVHLLNELLTERVKQ